MSYRDNKNLFVPNADQLERVNDLSDSNFIKRLIVGQVKPFDSVGQKQRIVYTVCGILMLIGFGIWFGFLLTDYLDQRKHPALVLSLSTESPLAIPAFYMCTGGNNSAIISSDIKRCNYVTGDPSNPCVTMDSLTYTDSPSNIDGIDNCETFYFKGFLNESLQDSDEMRITLMVATQYDPIYSEWVQASWFLPVGNNVQNPFSRIVRINLGGVGALSLQKTIYKKQNNSKEFDEVFFDVAYFYSVMYSNPSCFNFTYSDNTTHYLCINNVTFVILVSTTVQTFQEQVQVTLPRFLANVGAIVTFLSLVLISILPILLFRVIFKDRRDMIKSTERDSALWLASSLINQEASVRRV